MRKLVFGVVSILVVFVIGCSKQNSLVGKWIGSEISVEFFKDGEYLFTGPYTENGTWRDLGDGKLLMNVGADSMIGSYKIDSEKLTIIFENGDLYNFTRQNDEKGKATSKTGLTSIRGIDSSINGTWVWENGYEKLEFILNNGNFEEFGPNDGMKGTYTTKDGIITKKTTHINWGDRDEIYWININDLEKYIKEGVKNSIELQRSQTMDQIKHLTDMFDGNIPEDVNEIIRSLEEYLNSFDEIFISEDTNRQLENHINYINSLERPMPYSISGITLTVYYPDFGEQIALTKRN